MTIATTHHSLDQLDEAPINETHWRMIMTAGMGFFTDAYDLFIIGVVTALLVPLWHLSTTQLALLNGASLAAAAGGAICFGKLADKFGRKKMYGMEVLILFIGALLCALSPSFIFLLLARIIVGFGIGGDYPTSAVVASEYANRENRGFIVLLVFAMQAAGLIVGPLFASLLLWLHMPHEWVWRILLAAGAIPAASVFYLRRQINETPRFLLNQTAPYEVSQAVSELTGYNKQQRQIIAKQTKLFSKPWLKYLIGTAGAWFLLDVAFYGNGVSSVLIMKSIAPHANLLQHTLLSAMIFLCFAVPGYFVAAFTVDKIGRRPLQMLGFFIMAICYATISLLPDVTQQLSLFITLFGISFFFVNFGPNSTTFLVPSEIFPTDIRASAHGLSAAIGKLGAFVGAFALPFILRHYGLHTTMGILALVSLLGIFVTLLIPEMKQQSLQ